MNGLEKDRDFLLANKLEHVSPLDIDCQVLPDPDTREKLWFKHPTHENVYAKLGSTEKGVLRLWLRLDEKEHKVIFLIGSVPTPVELAYYYSQT